MDSFNLGETVNNIFGNLEKFFKTETVVGEPMQVGGITIVPFIDILFGMGAGGGIGTGGKISPTAILVIKGDQVELLPLKKAGNLERIIDRVPDIVENVQNKKNPD